MKLETRELVVIIGVYILGWWCSGMVTGYTVHCPLWSCDTVLADVNGRK